MLENKIYSISELLETIQKESLDNVPKHPEVVGPGVWKENSKNNEKAVKDIMKDVEEFDNVKEQKVNEDNSNNKDFNKTTLDVEFSVEPSKDYVERVEAQVGGYPSKENKKNSDTKNNPSLDYKGNEKFYDDRKEIQREREEQEKDEEQTGLKSKEQKEIKKNDIYTESKKMKRLQYNKEFLNEKHVINKIPDDYKVDGNRFMMRDVNGVEYIIECKKDKHCEDYIHTNIVRKNDPQKIDEEMSRIKQLFDYKSGEYFASSTCQSRKQENNALSENIDKVKDLMKNVK